MNPLALSSRRAAFVHRTIYLRDLVREMVVRDVHVKYKRSALGLAWSMLNPLLHLMVFYFLFQVVLSVDTPRFSSYALAGLLVWGWSAGALSQAAGAITSNRSLLRQPGFPSGMLPTITVTTHLIYFSLALPALLIFLIAGGSRPGWGMLGVPVLMAVQFILTLSMAYLVAAVNAYFRDTEHFLEVALRLIMFLSPVFYQTSLVPEEYLEMYRMNPMVPLLEGYRALLMFDTQPDWTAVGMVAFGSGLGLAVSYRLYRYAALRTVDEL